jgi:hypothetical protein
MGFAKSRFHRLTYGSPRDYSFNEQVSPRLQPSAVSLMSSIIPFDIQESFGCL